MISEGKKCFIVWFEKIPNILSWPFQSSLSNVYTMFKRGKEKSPILLSASAIFLLALVVANHEVGRRREEGKGGRPTNTSKVFFFNCGLGLWEYRRDPPAVLLLYYTFRQKRLSWCSKAHSLVVAAQYGQCYVVKYILWRRGDLQRMHKTHGKSLPYSGQALTLYQSTTTTLLKGT